MQWIGERPSFEDLSAWFHTVPLHDGMDHNAYVSGITLIEQIERRNVSANGRISAVEELIYTAYPRVETRIKYFWDMIERNKWVGKIEPVPSGEHNLPDGFFRLEVTEAGDRVVPLIGRAMQVSIWIPPPPPGTTLVHGWLDYPPEVRTVPLLRNGLVDPDAFAKASTGAIGRALGAAGILVLPGGGLSTAEDVPSSGALETSQSRADELSAVQGDPEEDRGVLRTLLLALRDSDRAEEMGEWWSSRHLPQVDTLTKAQLRSALAKARRLNESSIPVIQRSITVDD